MTVLEGIDLIKKMLNSLPDQRPTLRQILDHPWLSGVERPSGRLPMEKCVMVRTRSD
jgi:hypothetical protein